jgi:hypothetical protein
MQLITSSLPEQLDAPILPYGITILPSGDLTSYRKLRRAKSQQPENRSRRGLNGISSYARKQVRSACTLLEQRHGKDRLAFFTGTLPALSSAAMRYACMNWSEIVRQFQQAVKRGLERSGLDAEIIHVTEIQEKRYARTGLPVPHLHAVWHGREHCYSKWSLSIPQTQRAWTNAVRNVLRPEFPDIDDVDFGKSTNLQRVRKSSANYLSKYCSKGSKVVRTIARSVSHSLLPTAWHGMSRKLKTEIQEKTLRVDSSVGFTALRELLKRFGIKYTFSVRTSDDEPEIALISVIPPHLIDRFMIAYIELGDRFSDCNNALTQR